MEHSSLYGYANVSPSQYMPAVSSPAPTTPQNPARSVVRPLTYVPRPVTFVPDTTVRQPQSAPSTPSHPIRYAPPIITDVDGEHRRFGLPATPPNSATNDSFPPFVNTSPLTSSSPVAGNNSNLWTQNSGYWNPSYQGQFLAPADPRMAALPSNGLSAPHATLGSPFVSTPRKRPAPLIIDQGPLPKRPRPLSPLSAMNGPPSPLSLLKPPPAAPPQLPRLKRLPVPVRRSTGPHQYAPRPDGSSPPINVPVVGFYVTPPERTTGEVPGEALDLLPDTNWFVHRMRLPKEDGGNDNKLACALADSCVDLLGRAVRALSHDEWCLLNADDPTTVEAAALSDALEHLRTVRQQEGKESADKLYRSLQLLLFVQFRDVMSQQIVNDSAERGHRLTTSELMCLPDTRIRDAEEQFA